MHLVFKVAKDQKESEETKETLVLKVNAEKPDHQVELDQEVTEVNLDLLVLQDCLEIRETPVLQEREERREATELRAHLDLKDPLVSKDPLDHPETPETRDLAVFRVLLAKRDLKAPVVS